MNNHDRERLGKLEKKIDDIRDNHLSQIWRELGSLKGRWTIMIPLIVLMLGLIIGLYGVLLNG